MASPAALPRAPGSGRAALRPHGPGVHPQCVPGGGSLPHLLHWEVARREPEPLREMVNLGARTMAHAVGMLLVSPHGGERGMA